MKTYNFSVRTTKREYFIDINKEINEFIQKSGISNGYVKIFAPHTTAGVTINNNADINVQKDILNMMKRIIPRKNFMNIEGNSDAHFKSSLFGNSQDIFIENNRLKLGEWQAIYFCEFDGPRTRKVLLQIYGE
ncbi:MAG: secondary thiamine-phosphate synthase enzyme YjbQ [Promethearchaeota archaeon]